MNTPQQAIGYEQSQPRYAVGQCLRNVVTAYDVFITPGPDTAAEAFAATRLRGTDAPAPLGALLWWLGGQPIRVGSVWVKPGHVAIADGTGGCYSTDFTDSGFVGDGTVHHLQDYRNISVHDPAQVFQAWSRDLNGFTVVPAPQSSEDEMLVLKDFIHVQPGQNPPLYISLGDVKQPLSYAAFQLLAGQVKVVVKEVHKTGEPLYALLNKPTLSP